ncbi:MAG: CotH kinase family protein [Bacteroidaceae bacterium]|nr:CotH kinase family protein [Bacteroidaceae bacterium]
MNRKILSILALWCFAAFSLRAATTDVSQLVINEIQVANIDMFIDPSFNYGGWIEFYNPTDVSVSLRGAFISDNPSNPRRFRLSTSLSFVPAHGYKVIWFGHYDTGNKYSSTANTQVDFKLDYEGGTICLADSKEQYHLSQSYPPAKPRCSYARTTDGGNEWRWCATPTLEASNEGSMFADKELQAPVIDVDSKVFTSGFSVHVEIPEGATLYYTTDGSTPTLSSDSSSDGEFYVDEVTTIYRFRLFKEGYLPSPVVTRSYIYNDRGYYLPVVSVVTDAKNLYDSKIGAYTDGTNGISGNGVSYSTNKNREWERPVNFDYLVPEENDETGDSYKMALNQECDFEVAGGWSRNLFAPNSSFRLKGHKYYYGKNFLPYSFFKGKPYIKSKAIVVRNGGNDGYGRIKDAATHQIMLRSGLYVDCQEYQPVHVFINGVFQFTYNLREPSNKHHGYANYGMDTDEMDQFEINGSVGYEQKEGDNQAFNQWMTLATQLGVSPTNTSLYDQICELVDIDEYCNYMAAECYIGSTDWLTNSNNVKGYRDRNDGKFHLICLDLDAAFSSSSMLGSLEGSLSDSRYSTGKNFLIDIFLKMLKYEPFKKRFIDAFCLVDGSVFETERCRQIITEMRNYKYNAHAMEGSAGSLNSSSNWLINAISGGHSSRMSHLSSYFNLKNPIKVELSSNIDGATILANGQEVPTGCFKGSLYTPMVLTAKAPAGYRFMGWQQVGDGNVSSSINVFDTNDTWDYYDQGSLDGQTWKVLSYNLSSWNTGNAPFGYGNVGINGSADYQTTLDYGNDANNKRPTYYFRKTVELENAPEDKDTYLLRCYVDDGCVVYVNGHEQGRYLMPEGTITYETFSTSYASTTAGYCEFVLDNKWLRKGANVIAVEVHNTHEHSSDIYWTAELRHDELNVDVELSKQPEWDLSDYAGMNLSKVMAVYEPIPETQLMENLAFPLRLNELSASNSIFINDHNKKNDWFELYNPTDTDLDAAGLFVSNDPDDPLKYQIPSSSTINTIVPAHGYLVIWADKLEEVTQLHTPFKLTNDDEQALFILSSDEFISNNAEFFQSHPSLQLFVDGFTYAIHDGDQSVGRYPDGSNEIYLFHRPTINKANSLLTCDTFLGADTGLPQTDEIILGVEFAEEQTTKQQGDGALQAGYYNLYGMYLGEEARGLRPGLYVVRMQDGSSRKVLLR